MTRQAHAAFRYDVLGQRERAMSVKDLARLSEAVNWAANYVTPRNIGRYLGYRAMDAAVEVLWGRQRRAGDLAAAISDHFVRPGMTVIDVGASWGLFSYHLARRVGSEGLLYSFEPHPANAPVLQKLAAARPSVQFRPAAVSDAAGHADLHVPKSRRRLVTAQSSLAHDFGDVAIENVVVPTVRLDDEIGAAQRVDFIKIDVEGHEMSVLRGGSSIMRHWQPTVLIEIEQRHLSAPIRDVFRQLQDLGYHIFSIKESWLRPIGDFDLQRDQLSLVTDGQFYPFGMPDGYANNFCAVSKPGLLRDLPISGR